MGELIFGTREQCVGFLEELLQHKMFHRAKKIPVAVKTSNKDKKEKNKVTAKEEEEEEPAKSKGKDDRGKTSASLTKKKRKIRLDMHDDQIFVDSSDAYVWLYDPESWLYWTGGAAILLGAFAVCLFPLWPPVMRTGVHYLSMGVAGCLLVITAIGVSKYLLFVLLFVLSAGTLRFWLFPNLTEDVGFIESFMPVYDYTNTGKPFLGLKQKKAKDSDDELPDDSVDDDENSGSENSNSSTVDENSNAISKKNRQRSENVKESSKTDNKSLEKDIESSEKGNEGSEKGNEGLKIGDNQSDDSAFKESGSKEDIATGMFDEN